MSPSEKEKRQKWLLDIAIKAGEKSLEFFQKQDLQVQLKGKQDYVTIADKTVEEMIASSLKAAFPEDIMVGEETGGQFEDSKPCWFIDPIDGTYNFLQGIPLYCVSIGLYANGELQLAALYHPVNKELFFASKGEGATLNNKKIFVTTKTKADESLIGVGSSFKTPKEGYLKKIDWLLGQNIAYRRLGSAALMLAYVACGRLDGFFEDYLNPWDTAAGALLVQEAGGNVSKFYPEGGPIWASSKSLKDVFSIFES